MKRLLGALTVSVLLLLVSGTAFADDVGDLCAGDPNCSVLSDDGGFSDLGSDGTGFPGWFVGLFVLVLLVGIGLTVYRVSAARDMARKAGLDPNAAGTVALLDEDGLSAAYVASSLQRPSAAPAAVPPVRPAAERLAELQALKDAGAVTDTEYAARRQAIIDSI
jgi:hypothetical protein